MNIKISSIVLMYFMATVKNDQFIKRYLVKDFFLFWNTSGINPCHLNVNRHTNMLYFCLKRPKHFDSQIAFYNINTKETQTIMGIKKGCANAIDQENNVVYLGGLEGIYKFNIWTRHPEYFAEKNVHISSLFHRDRLYYIRHPDKKVFMEYKGRYATVAEFVDLEVDHFHISREGIVYFSVQNNIYVYDKNETKWDIKGLRKSHVVNSISEDNEGLVYLCTNRGVYKVVENGIQKFMHHRNIVGLTSDRDNNLILADDLSIFRLLQRERV